METSGESGKVTKENEVETLLLLTFFFATQDLSQAGGTTRLGLHRKKIKCGENLFVNISLWSKDSF